MTAKFLTEAAALQRAESYCKARPGSPSAIRCPKVFIHSGIWVALLGHNVREGIAGFGPTVEAALHAFDREYLNFLRPPRPSELDRAA